MSCKKCCKCKKFKSKPKKVYKVKQKADADIIQNQNAEQNNHAEQRNAIAVAILGGSASAIQYAELTNKNTQIADSLSNNASEIKQGEYHSKKDKNVTQEADAKTRQHQDVIQDNHSEQNLLVAAALGEDSSALALQYNKDKNENAQNAGSIAINENEKSSTPVNSIGMANNELEKLPITNKEILSRIKNRDIVETSDGTKVVMSIKQGNDRLEVQVNENGEIIVNDNKSSTVNPDTAAQLIDETLSFLNITINQGDENYEIKADEDGNIYLNGHKLVID